MGKLGGGEFESAVYAARIVSLTTNPGRAGVLFFE